MRTSSRTFASRLLRGLGCCALVPLLILSGLIVLPVTALHRLCLNLAIWTRWCRRGRDTLFLYTDSPASHDYVVKRFLPRLGARAVVINCSRSDPQRSSLARWATWSFSEGRRSRPKAVVFRPFRSRREFNFWNSFQESKLGRFEALRAQELEFFEFLETAGDRPIA
jgi:hypothetical protein